MDCLCEGTLDHHLGRGEEGGAGQLEDTCPGAAVIGGATDGTGGFRTRLLVSASPWCARAGSSAWSVSGRRPGEEVTAHALSPRSNLLAVASAGDGGTLSQLRVYRKREGGGGGFTLLATSVVDSGPVMTLTFAEAGRHLVALDEARTVHFHKVDKQLDPVPASEGIQATVLFGLAGRLLGGGGRFVLYPRYAQLLNGGIGWKHRGHIGPVRASGQSNGADRL